MPKGNWIGGQGRMSTALVWEYVTAWGAQWISWRKQTPPFDFSLALLKIVNVADNLLLRYAFYRRAWGFHWERYDLPEGRLWLQTKAELCFYKTNIGHDAWQRRADTRRVIHSMGGNLTMGRVPPPANPHQVLPVCEDYPVPRVEMLSRHDLPLAALQKPTRGEVWVIGGLVGLGFLLGLLAGRLLRR